MTNAKARPPRPALTHVALPRAHARVGGGYCGPPAIRAGPQQGGGIVDGPGCPARQRQRRGGSGSGSDGGSGRDSGAVRSSRVEP